MRPPSVGGEDDRRAKEQSATMKWNKRYTVLLTFKILSCLHRAIRHVLGDPEIRAQCRILVVAVEAGVSQGGWHGSQSESGWEVLDRRRRRTLRRRMENKEQGG